MGSTRRTEQPAPDRTPEAGDARRWEAIAAGLAHAGLVAASFPPFNLWPLIVLALAPLLWLSGRTTQRPARAALLVGLAQLPLWAFEQRWLIDVTPAGYPFMVLGMSTFAPLFLWMLARVRARLPALPLSFAVAILWVALEFLRGHILFTGYPWYLIAHPLIEWPPLASPAAIGGVYLVSLLMSAAVGAVADVARGRRIAGVAALLLVLGFWAGAIAWRSAATGSGADRRPFRIALVQTNVPQDNKTAWTEEQRVRDFLDAIDLSIAAAERQPPPHLIAWPETMYPGYVLEPESIEAIRRAARRHEAARPLRQLVEDFSTTLTRVQSQLGVPMLIGVRGFENLRVGVDEQGLLFWDADAIYNSAVVVEGGRVATGRYDKLHLTPFGEVMPYVHHWPWLEARLLALGAQGMQFELEPGAPAEGLRAGEATLATPICFEATMPAVARRLVFDTGGRRRAQIMTNLTNDGWFGAVDASRAQHLQSARWRCVELATPMARAANTGISCIIDARGRLLAALPPREAGVLHGEVALAQGATPYARLGDAVGWTCLAAAPLLLLLATWRRRRDDADN